MNRFKQAAEALQNADAVLIGAGAGLSAAAGLDYTDEHDFAERFPGMLQYGVRCQYQLMGYPFPDEALKWDTFPWVLTMYTMPGKSRFTRHCARLSASGIILS